MYVYQPFLSQLTKVSEDLELDLAKTRPMGVGLFSLVDKTSEQWQRACVSELFLVAFMVLASWESYYPLGGSYNAASPTALECIIRY